MPYEGIHACPKGCVLFRGDLEEAKTCPKCDASRFVLVEGSDGSMKQSKVPEKVVRHLPFLPRLQRLYMTEESAKQMTWHKNGKRYHPDKMVHPADGDAWKHFDNMNPVKAMEARNVRVALATDGFNPFGMMVAPYTCWPVFVIPLNLPPGVMFEPKNVLLTLIIPGHPGDNMGVFMQPVWDELELAWEEGGTHRVVCSREVPLPDMQGRCDVHLAGQTSWKIVSGAGQARHINGIQGLLIKEYYPGLVNVNGEMKVPTKWSHFYLVEEGGETIAAKIKREFWDFFTCEEGKAAQAARVQEAVCKDRLKDLYHEARIQAIRDFHANVLGENIKKPQIRQRMNSREADLTQAQYEQVCPSWCDNHRECWTEIVRMWRTDEAYARRADRQGRRAQMRGVSHHQGNQPLPQFATRWTQTHGGQEINEYTAYLLSHKGKATDPNNVYNPEDGPDAYTNPTAYEKATEYTVAARQRYGETFDPTAEPLDTDLLQRLGPGKQHGRYYMAHSALDPSQVPTLTQVRSTPTSSSDIPVAPRRQSASQAQMEAKMEERIATLHAQMMAQQMAYQQSLQQHYNTQMQNMASFFQSMQTPGASTPPPLPMFAPPPPPSEFFPVPALVAPGGTPVQSTGSNPSPGGPGHQMMSYPPPAPYPPYPPPRGPPPTYSWPPVRGGWQYAQAPQFGPRGFPWANPGGSGGGADDETGDGATS
ncbi:uncharacterized protein [Miscanthus floridulus]|uniref:uncharacterized protein n=1 Tax=Miscanthus floridulus TaxID=154761 RepID=UPI003458FEB1